MARVFDYIPKYHFKDEQRRKELDEGMKPGEMWVLVQDRYNGNWNHVMTRFCPALPLESISPDWCRALSAEAEELSHHVPVRIEVHPEKNKEVVFLPKEDILRIFQYKGGSWLPLVEIHNGVICDDQSALRRRGVHPYMADLEDTKVQSLPAAVLEAGMPDGGLYPSGWERLLPLDAIGRAKEIADRVRLEREDGKTIYPPQEMISNALHLTPPDKVKVVILGQDPYHGAGEACGLAFSVQPGIKVPPSLRNIFKVLQSDLSIADAQMPKDGDLTPWARRGVLLLNTLLTVDEGKPLSHAKYGWQDFTGAIISACAALPQPIVFLLWGAEAVIFSSRKNVEETSTKHIVVSSHPSPLAANRSSSKLPAFMQSHPFLEANSWLATHGSTPIDWRLI